MQVYKESDTLTGMVAYSLDIEDQLSNKWKAGFLYDQRVLGNFTFKIPAGILTP